MSGTGPLRTYVIYNLSMKQCKILPLPPFRIRNARYTNLLSGTIAFDPAKSNYYQVVGVCSADISKGVQHVEIYSSKTDSWRDAGDPLPLSLLGTSESDVYWNGSVDWLDQGTAALHYFDIDCGLAKTVAMPKQPCSEGDYSRSVEYFGECRGHMHLMEMRKDGNGIPSFDIWEMQMDLFGMECQVLR
ncbi:uncharacterized protein LOC113285901 [Papaver somniferum]|uniref:uncharacterized protein LOC113285901 n=1 Tax=Papaver somniferum TaxID=3469 RepID=UPI000E705697|nr:uncharacterized protein LOC113285901 [Papaver somniferum]